MGKIFKRKKKFEIKNAQDMGFFITSLLEAKEGNYSLKVEVDMEFENKDDIKAKKSEIKITQKRG